MDHARSPKEAVVEQHEEYVYDSANPLVSLPPPDVLISILCRVPACDHTALWKPCKAFCEVLDSDTCASERDATGWAEVTARLVPKEELYNNDYSDGPEFYSDHDSYDPGDKSGGDDEDLTEEKKDGYIYQEEA